ELNYCVQYKRVDGKWHMNTARSTIKIRLTNREKKEKTRFQSTAEILTTNIEKGDLVRFSRKDIFKPNEFFTEKITEYDPGFWSHYNVIQPEDELEQALKNFQDHDRIILK
ncbi:MAG TPA: hypothetical protein PLK12_14595, partial [Prolixibacteraceae bacterium]|nr:hypothetical protein [Prolixibacteraceae bacterium]